MNLRSQIAWWFRKKRLVIVHVEGMDASIEGILVGKWAGHYVLRVAKLIEGEDRSARIDGEISIPTGRVFFIQTISTDAS